MLKSPFFKKHLPTELLSADDIAKLLEFQGASDRFLALDRGFTEANLDKAVDVAQRAFMANPNDQNLASLHQTTSNRELRKLSADHVRAAVQGANKRYIQAQFCPWARDLVLRLVAKVEPSLNTAIQQESVRSVEMFGTEEGAEVVRRHALLLLARLKMIGDHLQQLEKNPSPDYSARGFVAQVAALGIDFPHAEDAIAKGSDYLKALSRAGVVLSPAEFAIMGSEKNADGQPPEEYYLQDQIIALEEARRAREQSEANAIADEFARREALAEQEKARPHTVDPSVTAAFEKPVTIVMTDEQAAATGVQGERPNIDVPPAASGK